LPHYPTARKGIILALSSFAKDNMAGKLPFLVDVYSGKAWFPKYFASFFNYADSGYLLTPALSLLAFLLPDLGI
jgi:hypothetical protein